MTDQNNLWELASLSNVSSFAFSRRIDLAAANTKRLSDSVFVIFEEKVPKNQVFIVRNFAPFAQRRINVGDAAQESIEMILPQEGDTWFAFEPQVNKQSKTKLDIDFNSPKNAGGVLNNNDRSKAGGTSFLSANPNVDALRWNPTSTFLAEADTELSVTFQLMPLSAASAIANPFTIAAGSKRVDFAGVVIAGVSMDVATFQRLQQQGKI
jgi:hypothetical protein